jgi:hypothetical protein
MSTPDLAQLPVDAALMLPDLPLSVCQDIAQLANPSGLHRLSEERLPEIKESLNTTCKRLKTRIAQSTRAESHDIMLMHEALKAAAEVIELLHQPT